MIAAGQVVVSGAPAANPGRLVLPGEDVRLLKPPPQFVSRAGTKLAAGLDQFGLTPIGLTVLDAGSSTGGFSDCVLQRGAARVIAVDVGTNQLHEKIGSDPRVEVREQTDIRRLEAADIGGLVDLTVGDLSFISLKLVLGSLIALTKSGADMVLLIKPQFEATKSEASRGEGVITDPEIWDRVIEEVRCASLSEGADMIEVMQSPITGTAGNVEFVAHFVVKEEI